MQIELPPYDLPPPWIPPEMRHGNPLYDNDLAPFLPRQVTLHRSVASQALGFNIRCRMIGELIVGIYISKVMLGTEADLVGLQEGDEILTVNGVGYDGIDHGTAVRMLKEGLEVTLVVRYFPHGYRRTYDVAAPLADTSRPSEDDDYNPNMYIANYN